MSQEHKQNITYRLLTLTYALRMLGHSDEANNLTLFHHHQPCWNKNGAN